MLMQVGKLELVVGISMHILAIFIYLMIFGVNIQHVWVLFTSIFLGTLHALPATPPSHTLRLESMLQV